MSLEIPCLLTVDALRRTFPLTQSWWSYLRGQPASQIMAVDNVHMQIAAHSTLGLVGESGCGKSTLGRCILRLIEPDTGRVVFAGQDVLQCDARAMRQLRRRMQIIFQDPYSSLNPRLTVGRMLDEVLSFHKLGANWSERRERVATLLEQVGLDPAHSTRYAHEFSGGQRQRIGIARALAVEPEFVVCDEPVSALDVSIQAQIINLLEDLQTTYGLTYLFISHDLGVVRYISTLVAVMYIGRIVEQAPTAELFEHPHHPYTKALLAAIPRTDRSQPRERVRVQGEARTEMQKSQGCPFRQRCPFALPRCASEEPPWQQVAPEHWSRCWLDS